MAVYKDSERAAPADDQLIDELVRFEHHVMKNSQVDRLRMVKLLDEDEREQLSVALRMVLANPEVR
jgi:hypothetical protein